MRQPRKENAAAMPVASGANQTTYEAHRIKVPAADQEGGKLAPFGKDVVNALANGGQPNVYIFAGSRAWERAATRREAHGVDSAMVLPEGENPLALRWPAVEAVVVAWPGCDDFDRKIDLGRALVRDGVRRAEIEHAPEWITVRASA